MIITILFKIFTTLIAMLFSLLPVVSALPSNISSAIGSVFGYMVPFNFLIPFPALFGALAFVLTMEVGLFTFKILVFIYNRLPFT